MFLQTFLVWAALSGAVFSSSLHAEEPAEKPPVVTEAPKKPAVDWFRMEILRGAQVKPYVIPSWFARRAPTEQPYVPEPESFVFQPPHVSASIGRPPKIGPQYACQRPNGTWVFCD